MQQYFGATHLCNVTPIGLRIRSREVGIRTRSQRNIENNVTEASPIAVVETINDGGVRVERHIHFCFATAIHSDPGEPKTFKEAMNSKERELWKHAVISEINNFLSRKAWKFVKRSLVKERGRRLVPTKHVFKEEN